MFTRKSGRKKLIIILSFLFVSIIALVLVNKLFFTSRTILRPLNTYELAYQSIAATTEKPNLCYKISPNALENGAGWSHKGYQIALGRSDCFYTVAFNSQDPSLCRNVVSYSTFLLDGSKISEDGCLEKVRQNPGSVSMGNGSLGTDGPRWILEELGYTEAMIPEYYKRNVPYDPDSVSMWINYYFELMPTNEFQQKVNGLPDYSNT